MLQGILPISWARIPADILAGLTLAALAIPEVMGYTKIAQAPVITGPYTLLIPMALFALFGSSRHLVVGADSATAAILASGLSGLATPGSAGWVALASLLALLAGGILLIARVVRLGFLADFLSRTVLVGFLTGVGVQVATGELPGLLGLPGGGHGVVSKLTNAVRQIGQVNPYDLAIAATVIGVILGARQVSRRIPGALIAVLGAILASWALDLNARGVAVLGAVPSGLAQPGLPQVDWSFDLLERLVPTAVAMSVVILAQSAATSRAYAARHSERLNENTDLVGLALANIGAGLTGTFVVNGSPTKTQMVDSAGGRSQLAQITTSLIVLVVLLFLTRPLGYMPNVVLSAVVFLIGLDLIDLGAMHQNYIERPSEFCVALITALAVMFIGVEEGILLAMALSLLDHVRRGYRPRNGVLVRASSGGLRMRPVAEPGQIRPGLLVYRFNHSMYYANAEQLSQQTRALVENAEPPLQWFCIDMAAVDDVDFSAAATLRSLHGVLHRKEVRLVLVEVSDDVRAELERYGLVSLFGQSAFYETIHELVSAFETGRRRLAQ
nr:SulP family inorganic anion transporter [Microvirga tunisiensis]